MEISLELSKADTTTEDLIAFLDDLSIDIREVLPGLLQSFTTKSDTVRFPVTVPYQRHHLERLLKLMQTQKSNPALQLPCQILEASIPFAPTGLELPPSIKPSKKTTAKPAKDYLDPFKPLIEDFIKNRGGDKVAANEINSMWDLNFYAIRVIIKELILAGKVIFTGKARATRYYWSETALHEVHQTFQNLTAELNYEIPDAYKNPLPKALAAPPQKLKIDWDNEPLGQMRDQMLAKRLGTTKDKVKKARIARKIPPFKKPIQSAPESKTNP